MHGVDGNADSGGVMMDYTVNMTEAEARQTVNDLMDYIDEAKEALGDWYITGRPVADCINDILTHYEGDKQ